MINISVTGKQVDVGNSLQTYATEHLNKIITKYFEHAIHSEVVFSKPSHKHENQFRADLTLNAGSGIGFIKSNFSGDSAYLAFDGALEKLSHRLSKYKSKIKNHHRPKISEYYGYEGNNIQGKKYVISPFAHDETELDPNIIVEKDTDIELLSVSEAIMKMDLADLPALLFRNKENNRINVVYHRVDGNISWIDPQKLNA